MDWEGKFCKSDIVTWTKSGILKNYEKEAKSLWYFCPDTKIRPNVPCHWLHKVPVSCPAKVERDLDALVLGGLSFSISPLQNSHSWDPVKYEL